MPATVTKVPPTCVAAYDVARANARHRPALLSAMAAVMDGNQFILGDHLRAFEQSFAEQSGTAHCIGVGNGLDALTLALRALGVGRDDEVIVPAYTFIATWLAVSNLGARPVPVDVMHDGNIDPCLIAAAVTARTRAIVPVHLFGRIADMDAILHVAGNFGLPVVEDAAQAHGAERRGRRAGSFGALSAFSFYPTKNLGALGDGGAVCTNDPALAAAVRSLRNYGSVQKYRHDVLGCNSRLDDLQAAFLSVKLPALAAANDSRRSVAGRYRAALSGLDGIACPDAGQDGMVWHQFVVRSADRDSLRSGLALAGVGTDIHYPAAPFDQPCYSGQHDRSRFPVAVKLASQVLSLPMAEYLSEAEVRHVIKSTKKAARRTMAAVA